MPTLSFLLETVKLKSLFYFDNWWNDMWIALHFANAEIHGSRKWKGKNEIFTYYHNNLMAIHWAPCGSHSSMTHWYFSIIAFLVCSGNRLEIIFILLWMVYSLASSFHILNLNNGSISIIFFLTKIWFLIMSFKKVRSFTID